MATLKIILSPVQTKLTEKEFRENSERDTATGQWFVVVRSKRALIECASCVEAIQTLERETHASR